MPWPCCATAGWVGSWPGPTPLDVGLVPANVHLRARQLDAIASRSLIALAGLTRVLGPPVDPAAAKNDGAGYTLLDVDDTILEVHGHAKQGAGFGYSGVVG